MMQRYRKILMAIGAFCISVAAHAMEPTTHEANLESLEKIICHQDISTCCCVTGAASVTAGVSMAGTSCLVAGTLVNPGWITELLTIAGALQCGTGLMLRQRNIMSMHELITGNHPTPQALDMDNDDVPM